MIEIVRQNQKFKPDIGDLIYDKNNVVHGFTDLSSPAKYLNILYFRCYNSFENLNLIGISPKGIVNIKYHCPLNGKNQYYGIVPVAIRTKNPETYRINNLKSNVYDWIFDIGYQSDFNICSFNNNGVISSFLGHGYNFCELPNDGDIKKVFVDIELSNGDYIIAITFEWYNR